MSGQATKGMVPWEWTLASIFFCYILFLIAGASGMLSRVVQEERYLPNQFTWEDRGMIATRYHPDLIGELMANKKPFDTEALTCATSEMFALGERLKVTNLDNGRSVDVLVTDRHDNLTDIDLSFVAYTTLRDWDLYDSGRITVKIERINDDR